MRASIVIVLLMFAVPAVAQPTMALWVDAQGELTNNFEIPPATTFDIVVTLDSDGHDVSQVHWGMTDPFDLGLIVLNDMSPIGTCGLIPENCFDGTYSIAVNGDCHPAGERLEVMRISCADFTGTAGADVVAVIGPVDPSSTDPAFVDCDENVFAAPMGGYPGGTTAAGVEWPDGGLILNPTDWVLDVTTRGLSALKARY